MEQTDGNFMQTKTDRKHCLFLLPRPLFPVVSGYSNKNVNLLDSLAKTYALQLFVLTDHPLSEEELAFYRERNIRVTQFCMTKADHILGALRAVLQGKPLQVGYYYSRRVQRCVDETIKALSGNDFVTVAGLVRTADYLLQTAAPLKKEQRFFDMVDSIGLSYQRSAAATGSFFWKLIYGYETGRLLRYEKQAVRNFGCTFFINQEEEKQYREDGKTVWLPHGVKKELLEYNRRDTRWASSVVFLGKMNYQPNIDAVRWYIEHVHKNIGSQVPLIVTGAYPVKELEKLAEQYGNITLTGYCDDPYIYLNSALAVIAPMQSGGGIQNKVLEAMALGRPTILTPLAAEAITGAIPGKHFIVAETAEAFEQAVLEIKNDPEKFAEIGKNAKELIRETYTWENYCRGYLAALQNEE